MSAAESFAKDVKTGIVHNIDPNEYERHLMARKKAILEKNKGEEISEIKKELQGIKIVINKILEIVAEKK